MQLAIVIPLADLGGGHPGNALPGFPGYPSQGLPGSPGHPSQGLPFPPGGPAQLPVLPPEVWPPQPGAPSHPIHLPPPPVGSTLPIYPADPTHPIALPPGVVWPPLPPSAGSGKAIALVAISGVGYRWTVVDLSLTAGFPMPSPT